MRKNSLVLNVRWESNLSANDRYDRRSRPKLRLEVAAWQEEVAWTVKTLVAHSRLDWSDDLTLVVDIEMRFPDDGMERDADNYLKSLFDGLEMGLGINDSRFIPFIRRVQTVPVLQAGFTVRVYPAHLRGRGILGRIGMSAEGKTVIVLDETLPSAWLNERVSIDLGVVMED